MRPSDYPPRPVGFWDERAAADRTAFQVLIPKNLRFQRSVQRQGRPAEPLQQTEKETVCGQVQASPYLPPFSENSPIFRAFPFAKIQPVFLPEPTGRIRHRTPFPPSAAPAGITHYPLQAKSCAKEQTPWEPRTTNQAVCCPLREHTAVCCQQPVSRPARSSL